MLPIKPNLELICSSGTLSDRWSPWGYQPNLWWHGPWQDQGPMRAPCGSRSLVQYAFVSTSTEDSPVVKLWLHVPHSRTDVCRSGPLLRCSCFPQGFTLVSIGAYRGPGVKAMDLWVFVTASCLKTKRRLHYWAEVTQPSSTMVGQVCLPVTNRINLGHVE